MNNILTSAEGLSSAIQSIQEELYTALPNFWSGDIEGFGKVYKNIFCFLTGDKDTTTDNLLFTSQVKIVFMVNLSMIYPGYALVERQDSRAQKDVVEILRKINGNYKINEIEKGIDNIFNEYTTTGIRFDDLHPLHVFSVNIELDYYLTDKCT